MIYLIIYIIGIVPSAVLLAMLDKRIQNNSTYPIYGFYWFCSFFWPVFLPGLYIAHHKDLPKNWRIFDPILDVLEYVFKLELLKRIHLYVESKISRKSGDLDETASIEKKEK